MRYYVTTDIHGYFSEFMKALTDTGFFEDKTPHKLIICGDLFDRGQEALKLQEFILDLMEKDEVILIKGNHEDLMIRLLERWDKGSWAERHNHTNRTMDTVFQLTKATGKDLITDNLRVRDLLAETPYIKKIIPSMINYFETENYIFTHGWVPCIIEMKGCIIQKYTYIDDWRKADDDMWNEARWINGIEAAHRGVVEKEKTIVCGHWHCSYGHAHFENDGGEFFGNPNFNPYYGDGIIALDAATAFSGRVNCIVIED